MDGSGDTETPTDDELIAAINRGDHRSFEMLYRRHRDWVVRLAHRFTGNRHDALDVLQETFLYVLRKFPGFELEARFTTFLYPVVKNTALTLKRRRGRLRLDPSPAESAVEVPEGSPADARSELAAVVTCLSEEQREVLLLRYVDDLALEDIAVAVGIPLGTVKSRLHHALARLRDDPRTRRYFDIET